jgi:hypothetical protein
MTEIEIGLPGHAVLMEELKDDSDPGFGLCLMGEEEKAHSFYCSDETTKHFWINIILGALAPKDFRVSQDSVQEGSLAVSKSSNTPKFSVLFRDRLTTFRARGGSKLDEYMITADSKVVRLTDSFGIELTYRTSRRHTRQARLYASTEALQNDWFAALSMVHSRINVPALFNGTLADAVTRPTCAGLAVPLLVKECVEYILTNALHVEGIFRVPGNNNRIQELKSQYERDITTVLDPVRDNHNVTGILKLYLRELSDPVIPFGDYSLFIRSVESDEFKQRCKKLAALCNNLPLVNKTTLNYIVHFLTQVDERSAQNLMTSSNCAMVFAPSLLRRPVQTEAPSDNRSAVAAANQFKKDAELSKRVIECLLEGYSTVFPAGPPVVTRAAGKAAYQQSTNLQKYMDYVQRTNADDDNDTNDVND